MEQQLNQDIVEFTEKDDNTVYQEILLGKRHGKYYLTIFSKTRKKQKVIRERYFPTFLLEVTRRLNPGESYIICNGIYFSENRNQKRPAKVLSDEELNPIKEYIGIEKDKLITTAA